MTTFCRINTLACQAGLTLCVPFFKSGLAYKTNFVDSIISIKEDKFKLIVSELNNKNPTKRKRHSEVVNV